MESFFLAETIKYLYLIFDDKNFLHSNGEYATEYQSDSGINNQIFSLIFFSYFIYQGSCFLDTGYVYNTEAHPIDIGSLDCCSSSNLIDKKSSKTIEKNLLVKKKNH